MCEWTKENTQNARVKHSNGKKKDNKINRWHKNFSKMSQCDKKDKEQKLFLGQNVRLLDFDRNIQNKEENKLS